MHTWFRVTGFVTVEFDLYALVSFRPIGFSPPMRAAGHSHTLFQAHPVPATDNYRWRCAWNGDERSDAQRGDHLFHMQSLAASVTSDNRLVCPAMTDRPSGRPHRVGGMGPHSADAFSGRVRSNVVRCSPCLVVVSHPPYNVLSFARTPLSVPSLFRLSG